MTQGAADQTTPPEENPSGVIDVAVVMAMKDAAKTLPSSLAALRAQRASCRWELVVVDDHSRDGSAQLARDALAAMPNARVIVNDRTPGIAGARNAGILATTATVTAFCDADDRVDEGWVQAAHEAARDGGAFSGLCRELRDPVDPQAPIINPGGVFHNAFGAAFRGCNAAVNTTLLRAVGGFDESLGRYGHEDSELCVRLTKAGEPIRPAPEMVVHFRETTSRVAQVCKVWRLANAEYIYWARHPDRFAEMLDPAVHMHQVVGAAPYYAQRLVRREPLDPSAVARDVVTRLGRLRASRRWAREGQVPPALLLGPLDD